MNRQRSDAIPLTRDIRIDTFQKPPHRSRRTQWDQLNSVLEKNGL